MFNKPALCPKTAESPASRTIRPSGSLSGSPGATVRGGDAAGALSPRVHYHSARFFCDRQLSAWCRRARASDFCRAG